MPPRTCRACGINMVPRRPGQIVPEGHRNHAARGYCSGCYIAPSDAADGDRLMWTALPAGDIPLPVFDRYAPPPPWADDALCAQTDPDLFFPEKGGSTRAPKAVCAACPTRTACLDYALDNGERYGVWGGMTPAERAAILRDRAAS